MSDILSDRAIHCLKKVIQVLTNLGDDGQFNMRTWWQNDDCRTVACAAGWTAFKAPELGLKLDPEQEIIAHTDGENMFYGYGAIAKAFDITERLAEFFFSATSYETVEFDWGPEFFRASRDIPREEVVGRIKAYIYLSFRAAHNYSGKIAPTLQGDLT